jgi:hypothetical protein
LVRKHVSSCYRRGNSNRPIELVLLWVGHLHIPELDDKELLTAEFIHEKIEQDLRPGAAEYIAPVLPPGRLPEMLCFDPNRCSCLKYPGSEQLGSGWSLMASQNITFPTCRVDSTKRLAWGSHRTCLPTTGNSVNGTSYIEVDVQPCSASTQCLQVEYRRRITIIPHGQEGPVLAGGKHSIQGRIS